MKEKFQQLVHDIRSLRFTKATVSEKDIENQLENMLKKKNYEVIRQKSSHFGRTDLIVKFDSKKICLELKQKAYPVVFRQLDRYSIENDGLILVCWRASQTVRDVIAKGKKTAIIPIELIELRTFQSLW